MRAHLPIFAIVVLVFGCAQNEAVPVVHDVFKGFTQIEGVQLAIDIDGQHIVCDLTASERDALHAVFTTAIRDFRPAKWEVFGDITVYADGKTHKWKFLNIGASEVGVRVNASEYVRGIDRGTIYSLLTRCKEIAK